MAGRRFKIGDKVRISDENNRWGNITAIRKGQWEDRGGRKWRLHWYCVPSPLPGTPVEWYLARQLQHYHDAVSGVIVNL